MPAKQKRASVVLQLTMGEAMARIAWWLVAVVAALHIVFMAAEMFAWTWLAPNVAGLDDFVAKATIPLGRNQGLYNGFLAAGLVWSLWRPKLTTRSANLGKWPLDRQWAGFFLLCVLFAGVFGGLTIRRPNFGLLGFQALPALGALVVLWLLTKRETDR
jgi:putative membrane protein